MKPLLGLSLAATAGFAIVAFALPDGQRLRDTLSTVSPNELMVRTATKNVGDKLVALDVLLFPPSMAGAAEGHFA